MSDGHSYKIATPSTSPIIFFTSKSSMISKVRANMLWKDTVRLRLWSSVEGKVHLHTIGGKYVSQKMSKNAFLWDLNKFEKKRRIVNFFIWMVGGIMCLMNFNYKKAGHLVTRTVCSVVEEEDWTDKVEWTLNHKNLRVNDLFDRRLRVIWLTGWWMMNGHVRKHLEHLIFFQNSSTDGMNMQSGHLEHSLFVMPKFNMCFTLFSPDTITVWLWEEHRNR